MFVKTLASKGKRLLPLVIFPVAALITGCGGGYAYDDPDFASTATTPSQAPKSVQRPAAYGDFNPNLWNEHKWYECDCSRDPSAPVKG
jgi:hypothetical protein